MTRAELLRRMSAPEYVDWVALYALEAYEREQEAKRARARRRRPRA